jgi:hypothetical protein
VGEGPQRIHGCSHAGETRAIKKLNRQECMEVNCAGIRRRWEGGELSINGVYSMCSFRRDFVSGRKGKYGGRRSECNVVDFQSSRGKGDEYISAVEGESVK